MNETKYTRADFKAFWKDTYRLLCALIAKVDSGTSYYVKGMNFDGLILPHDILAALEKTYKDHFIVRRKAGTDLYELCFHPEGCLDTIIFIASINKAYSHATDYQIANIFTDSIVATVRDFIKKWYEKPAEDAANDIFEEIQQLKKELEERDKRLDDIEKQIDEVAREVTDVKRHLFDVNYRGSKFMRQETLPERYADAKFNGEHH